MDKKDIKLFREFDSIEDGLRELLASAKLVNDKSMSNQIIIQLARLETTISVFTLLRKMNRRDKVEHKAETRREFEESWRSHFLKLKSLTLETKGVKAAQLYEEMRDIFEATLLMASNENFGNRKGSLTEEK